MKIIHYILFSEKVAIRTNLIQWYALLYNFQKEQA